MRNAWLNGLTPAQFLHRHRQKKPLLARAALPQFAQLVTRLDLMEMAQHPDVEARLIVRDGGHWQVSHGPFRKRDFARLPAHDWTLLVQGVNHVLPQAQQLLAQFAFIPHARLDDLMVSYAPPGGGVGPHFDSYDVFLLQGEGRRRWRISAQRDLSLVDDAPLKILRRFRPGRAWDLAAGDVLYLPPRHAHDGVALEDCITCSVGFRAPSAQELCSGFFDFLQDRITGNAQYADPQLTPTQQPGRISSALTGGLLELLRAARWNRDDMQQFIGCYLSTPKPHVAFTPPRPPLRRPAFSRAAARSGIQLALPAIILYDERMFYLNGEAITVAPHARAALRRLADRRMLAPPLTTAVAGLELLYAWYRAGFVEPARHHR